MYTIEIVTKSSKTAQVACGDTKEMFTLLGILEDSKNVTGYRLFQGAVQYYDLYAQFGWGDGFKLIKPVNPPVVSIYGKFST